MNDLALTLRPRWIRPLAHRSDLIGIAASLACVVHCFAAPFLLLLLPSAGAWWSHPAAHVLLALLVLPLALWVIGRGYRKHRRPSAVMAAVLGVDFVVAGLLLPEFTPHAAPTPAPPGAPGGLAAQVGAPECVEACCPSLHVNPATGDTRLSLPPASIATIIGSVLLVLGHGINLQGCRCSRRASPAAGCHCV